MGTQHIVGVDRNQAQRRGASSKTQFYWYYNIDEYMTPLTNNNDYEHIPCAELLRDPALTWTTATEAGRAIIASMLNLNEFGFPFTFQAAITGEHKLEWKLEADKEIRKLIAGT
jgi:hypothetical protein